MPKKSAGILLYKISSGNPEVLLVHPGGPLWKNRDSGAWSIPKGEFSDNEEPLAAAKREVEEELGKIIEGEFLQLNPVKLKSGKIIFAWACEGEFDPIDLKSNDFELEWPPKSGIKRSYPEVDKAEWFDMLTAREKINAGQIPLLNQLESLVKQNRK